MKDLLDTHTAIVGASGAGKTVTAKGHVETLLEARRHVAVIDPTGAWYGLRSNADGDGPGFDIPIFGGPRGDVQITADQGEAIGAIIAGGVSAVVDVSSLRTGSEQRHFVRDLCRRLRAKPDGNFHLVVDEADEFAAQKPRDDYGFQVGEELIWMAKRGRLAGFVLTLITQRPASIDKEVLTQAQTLIIHQLVAPVDQKPVLDYLRDHASKTVLGEIKASLASLGRGERWIYAPRLGVLERGISPPIATFDSSRTPAPGEQAVEPKMLASIDLAEIRKALAKPLNDFPVTDNSAGTLKSWATADLIDELEQRDPEWLKSQPEFQAAVRDRDEWQAKAECFNDQISAAIRALGVKPIDEIAGAIEDRRWADGLKRATGAGSPVEDKPGSTNAVGSHYAPAGREAGAGQRRKVAALAEGVPTPSAPAPTLNAAARKMVDMLDKIAPARVPWGSLAAMIGNKARGGNFNAARKAMRESGLIVEEGDTVRSAAPATQGMTRGEAFALWLSVLSNPANRMMITLSSKAGKQFGMTRVQLGEALGIAPRGGNFNSGVAQLLRNGVAVDRGGVLHLAEPLPGERE